jgi:hypothetical protein
VVLAGTVKIRCRAANSAVVAVRQEEDEVPVALDREYAINGERAPVQWVCTVDDGYRRCNLIQTRGRMPCLVIRCSVQRDWTASATGLMCSW